MRVALVHNRYLQRGGEDVVVDAECQLLASAHEVELFETSSEALPASALASAALTIWNEGEKQRLGTWLRRFQPKVVHVHNTFPYLSPAVIWAAKEQGVPVIQTLHNYRLLCVNGLLFRDGQPCEDCVGRLPVRGVVHACYRESRPASAVVAGMLSYHRAIGSFDLVEVFVALTEFALQKFVEGGLPEDRIVVKPNFTLDMGVGEGGGEYALFVGRLSPEKGLETLLSAWRLVGPRLPLKIVGDGPLAEPLRAEPQPGVTHLGPRAASEVRQLMKEARLLIFPSEWYETFGLVVVEAMSCGTPSLVSSVSVASDLVRHRVTGLHFQAGDPVSLAQQVFWALDHPDKWQEMRRAARLEYETHYTPEANVKMLEDIYRRAIEHHGQRGRR